MIFYINTLRSAGCLILMFYPCIIFFFKPDSNPLCKGFIYMLGYFTSLGLILVQVTFFWYGGEKRPPSTAAVW